MSESAPASATEHLTTPHLVALRRYPVKSMGGESLGTVELDARGLAGDRAFAVRDADGRLASGKNTRRMVRRDGVFQLAAHTDGDMVIVTKTSDSARSRLGAAGDPAVDAAVSAALGADVRVAPETDVRHFDAGAVSIVGTATLEWCARELAVDADPRRLRANLVIQTTEPFEEEGWVGSALAVGTARLAVARRIERCRTIDLAQDGVAQPTRWLKQLGERRELRVGVYCDVATPGTLAVGDVITVLPV